MKLTYTRAAVEAYDTAAPILLELIGKTATNSECLELLDQLEKLEYEVGIAFGIDTADRNNMDTCRECIRPGPAIPPPGEELSFVRRMLLKEDT